MDQYVILCDGSYVIKSLQSARTDYVDMTMVFQIMRQRLDPLFPGRRLLRIYFYDGKLQGVTSVQRQAMDEPGVRMIYGHTTYGAEGVRQKGVDGLIILDMVKLSEYVSDIVLVSGDADFVPAVEYVQNKGVRVHGVSFDGAQENVSRFLHAVLDGMDVWTAREVEKCIQNYPPGDHTASFQELHQSLMTSFSGNAQFFVENRLVNIPPEIDRQLISYAIKTSNCEELPNEERISWRERFKEFCDTRNGA